MSENNWQQFLTDKFISQTKPLRETVEQIFQKDPDKGRQYFRENPHAVKYFLHQLASLMAYYPWIEPLYRQYLTPQSDSIKALSLDCGEAGHELLFLRNFLPEARIAAVNDEITTALGVVESFSDVELHSFKLGMVAPEKIIETIGFIPDIVICRHPIISIKRGLTEHLADWAKIVEVHRGQMLITNYANEERSAILQALVSRRIKFKTDEFADPPGIDCSWRHQGEYYTEDKLITVVNY